MKILHISLTPQGSDYVCLRYFWDNPTNYKEHRLPLAEIEDLRNQAETNYYTRLPVKYATTGKALYNWLDKNDRILANALKESHQQGLIIAIATDKGLANLPWELLHDGNCFLVEKQPPILPVRWVSQGKQGKPITGVIQPQNRALNVLFMATSPLDVEPELDYETEEGQILEATQRTPVNLRVEESGCLTELGYLVREYEEKYFDIFHLTGHATHQDEKPCFLTEDEYGGLLYSNTSAIATALRSPLPPLIFLSGCRTGDAADGAVPSMAEELLNLGATAVLGWGQNVRDTDATAAASSLYWELSQGETVAKAIASTYQALINQNAPDWHKLRLYVGNNLPQALVTPLRTKGRKQLPKPTTTLEFRDDEKRLRVASREEFVGRRRQLQNCLRTFKTDFDKVGVLIHGMGGWGKSSIASRLWDRLAEHEKVLWWRQIDESNLIKKLSSKLIKPELREIRNILEANDDSLEVKLTYLFSQLAELGEKPFLLILDDFELNLEPRDGGYILKPEVAPILEALVRSIQETGTENKIIITCRYDFDSDLLDYFYKQGLEPFRKADLTKKLSRLKNFNSDKISEDVRERALNLADGNPRLLEFLNNDILGKKDAETKLTELEQSPELWKDKIIWEELYQLIDEPLQQVLSHCLVYEIPVPMTALEVVCESISNYKQQLQRGLYLGLIEVSSESKEEVRVYRVPGILSHIIPSIKLPEDKQNRYKLFGIAADSLHQLWANKKNKNQNQWAEIFRVAFSVKDNQQRFREEFQVMLDVQYNGDSDKAYEQELRKLKSELSTEKLCQQLEEYLKQGEWRKSDEETAWIWYQLMVLNEVDDFFDLAENFPEDILKEMDDLWSKYSQGKFGFSVQKKIYLDLGGTMEHNNNIWDKFDECVGWKCQGGGWLPYSNFTFDYHNSYSGNLPCFPYSRGQFMWWGWGVTRFNVQPNMAKVGTSLGNIFLGSKQSIFRFIIFSLKPQEEIIKEPVIHQDIQDISAINKKDNDKKMKPKVYVETSVISYLTSRPSRDIIVAGHQQITQEWWQNYPETFDLVASQLVVQEASAGDSIASEQRLKILEQIELLLTTEESLALAQAFLEFKIMPQKAAEDALHIAIAVTNGIDYLLTWNCKHIANAIIRREVERICRSQGYEPVTICTPEELIER